MATEDGDNFRYLIVQPENGGITDLFRYGILGNKASGAKFFETSDEQTLHEELSVGGDRGGGETPAHRWVIIVSIVMRKLIKFFGKPMEWTGYVVDFLLNLLSLNGGLLGLLFNLLQGKMVIPVRGSATYISTIGHIDGRIDLMVGNDGTPAIQLDAGNRSLMDLCMMASKLAYENAIVIKNVVNQHWKMHFIDFYNCWNDYQKERSTQVFIFSDKPKDANLIVISFRGTEPFDADDWITDFDYSWYEIPKLGKVHMGFLEAMGLGNRINTSSFQQLLQATNIKLQSTNEEEPKKLLPEMGELSAYLAVRSKLKSLLNEHKNAKFMVTGHSLGGALAILFPIVLVFHEEDEVLQRMIGVHTFGQPRVGNRELGRYMESKLQQPNPRYFRVVYCNDIVPRLPYDNKTFLYKHFGVCLYYDSLFVKQKVDEEPNRNDYGLWYLIPEHLNAVWELARGMTMGMAYGPEYKESWEGIVMRLIGLAIPGLSAHGPPNYVNSIRLGTEKHIQMSNL
ncbi:unnamed protein product [Lactuca virosa]|uniref:Fungal lipase-type domain-containing protein n=1 Tax=Lactuca virosa TaxID=75947 RepID=A0AAU9M507_9ASTR|nr:unnamed protein product [Lactuca virosa]